MASKETQSEFKPKIHFGRQLLVATILLLIVGIIILITGKIIFGAVLALFAAVISLGSHVGKTNKF